MGAVAAVISLASSYVLLIVLCHECSVVVVAHACLVLNSLEKLQAALSMATIR
jgi:hypothetical protein